MNALKKILVDPGQEKIRLDHYLVNKLKDISREKIKLAISKKLILVNNHSTKPGYLLKKEDEIEIFQIDSLVSPKEIIPEDLPLEIIYEDDDIMVINKKAGVVVHPGCNNFSGTIANGLAYRFKALPQKDNHPHRPGLVHRLDKNTSGLLLIAKNEFSMAFLGKQFENHTIHRSYIALAWNDIILDHQKIEKNLIKSPQEKKVLISPDLNNGKSAVTNINVIERYGFATLIECILETGRTHQIRVHLNSIGHPIFGDETYGGKIFQKINFVAKSESFLKNCYEIMPHQALHAKTLGFIHPKTKKELFFDSSITENFATLISKLKNISKNN